MTAVFTKSKEQTQRPKEKGHVTSEAEFRMCRYKPRVGQDPQKPERGKEKV